MEPLTTRPETTHLESGVLNVTEIEIERLFRNSDQNNLVAPLREARARRSEGGSLKTGEGQQRAALALQQEWESWLVQRELLRNEIKRGKEILDQVRKELAETREELEAWPAFERICGRNPLMDYMQTLTAKERIEQFLPQWLERREAELTTLNQQMERCAKQNGLEHLL